MLFDFESDEESASEQLRPVQPAYLIQQDTEHTTPPREPSVDSGRTVNPHKDPGLVVLLGPGYLASHIEALDSPSGSVSNGSPAMTDQGGVNQTIRVDEPLSEPDTSIDSRLVDASALTAQAAAALATEATSRSGGESREPAKRVDSAQDNELPQATSFKQPGQSERATPLKLQTGAPIPGSDDTITTSPRLARHTIPVEEGNVGTLPALQPTSPTTNGVPTSPQSERLPSFRQLTQLANAATQKEARPSQYSHHHSQSFGSTTAPSPVLPYHIPPNPHLSPSSQYTFSARSPTSTMGDHYSSPTQYPGNAYYMERRTSAIHDHTIGVLSSLPSASSSGESHGPAGSSTDGYSTSHTTPVDSAAILPDGAQRNMPILPPPRGMPQSAAIPIGGFKCDWPGCDAASFATQYLLSSHRNVHSSARPHYCPVENCPRSEGGKGFKRKNEMIRHGLVHNSPGYVCPFCPEREHKYPRPDNLQRHVRAHHGEKDREDPQLREVLNQRMEGLGKTRRKRANTGPS